MANVTSGGAIKHLYKPRTEITIVPIVKFLNDLNAALSQATTPTDSTSKLVRVPDDRHPLSEEYKAILTYENRRSGLPGDLSNLEYLYMTDVAALLDETKDWLERETSTVTRSVPEAYNLIRTITEGRLLDRARVTRGQAIIDPESGKSEATDDGYDEQALGPDRGFNLLNDFGPYDSIRRIASILLLAAAIYQKSLTGETTVDIGSLQALISEVNKSASPIDSWKMVKVFATLLAES